jgi:hypothetical protein
MSTARTYLGPLRASAEPESDAAFHEGGRPVSADVGPLRVAPGSLAGAPAAEAGPATPAEIPAPLRGMGRLRSFTDSPPESAGSLEYNDVLGTAHAPTVRMMHQLREARHRLHRAASPELGLFPAIRALLRTEQRLGRPLRVAICGETNAGKSSLANLLAGIESLPTAVTINTLIPTLLYYAAEPEIWAVKHSGKRERLRSNRSLPREEALRIEVGLPSPRLSAMQVLDLPGLTGARWSAPFVDLASHHVDATIWCTVSTQAWKESERSAWSMLSPRLSARSLLVATHSDLLRRPEDGQSLMARLQHEVGTSFTSILPLATLDAIAVMGEELKGGAAWVASGANALEAALAALLVSVREQRAASAQAVTGRIAHRALTRIERQFGSAST